MRTLGGEQLGARSLFDGMPQPGEPVYDDADRQMFEIIHDGGGWGGCYEGRQVDDSEFTQSSMYIQPGMQPGTYPQSDTYIQQTDSYTGHQE